MNASESCVSSVSKRGYVFFEVKVKTGTHQGSPAWK